MALGLSMSMNMEQRLDQRLELQQRLEQKLEQQLELEMTLELYLEQEDFIKGLIRWADEHNSWVNFGKDGFNFTYALLPYEIAKPVADKAGPGFSHCMFNPFEMMIAGKKTALAEGDWTLFVVNDLVPEDCRDFVAVHERGEEISSADHYFASQLEFALASKRKKVRPYTKFIDANYPTKFIDLTQKVMFPILPEELIAYLSGHGKRNEPELAAAQKLIENHPIPAAVLKKMDKYESTTENVCDMIQGIYGTQHAVYRMLSDNPGLDTVEKAAELVNDTLARTLLSVKPSEARVISRIRVNERLQMFDRLINQDAYRASGRHLAIPIDFDKAYEAARKGERLVTPLYKIEDKKDNSSGLVTGYKKVV